VLAEPGANTYTELSYSGKRDSFCLNLAYEGHSRVAGRRRLPAIVFDFGHDEYDTLARHVLSLHAGGALPRPRSGSRPEWWNEPVVCGWGAQCHAAALAAGSPQAYSRQDLYEALLATLGERGISPGIVVIDDKWQATYGGNEVDTERWPDLRGFVDRQHAQGRRVLLWLKAWDPEGVPQDECVNNAAGLPVAVDPSHLRYERRLRAAVRRMLGEAGCNADGFKVDFTARGPSGPGLRANGRLWGLELLRRYLETLYTEAKRIKPDALIMTHTPHPYLADVTDMIRLNDLSHTPNIEAAMRHRARVARLACPAALIDTDNWPMADRAAWRAYIALQPELGVPSLYFGSHIDSTGEALDASDYALIRQAWDRHRARQPG
jgi:hypothetical protein